MPLKPVRTLAVAAASALFLQAQPPAPQRAVIDKYCVTCHNQQAKTAGLLLDQADLAAIPDHAELWEKVVRRLRTGSMPPAGMPRPDKGTNDALAAFLETKLDSAKPDPGRTETLHRLNRTEYQNAIHDLLALDIDAASLLPADDSSYGFDNIAGVLKMSPVLMERFTTTAQKISRIAIGSLAIPPTAETFRVPSDLGQDERLDGMPFGTRGGISVHFTFPVDADYGFQVKIARDYTDSLATFVEPHQIEVSIDGERVQLFTIGAKPAEPPSRAGRMVKTEEADAGFQVRLPVKAGPHNVQVAFLKRTSAMVESVRSQYLRPAFGAGGDTRLEPYLGSVSISGPFNAKGPGDTPSRRRIFVCRPKTALEEAPCARQILSTLARRAYRRPVTDADLTVLLGFYNDGRSESFDAGIEMALRRMLVSPSFLFRIERDPAGIAPNTAYRLGDLELASRLSFFLWSTIPDDQLLDLASKGKLKDPAILEQQVHRMLADPRSQSLVKNFTGQWLYLRNLPAAERDTELFPDFDENLRQAFRQETEMFFDSILRENRSTLDLLTANYTFVNERLARHYGIPGIYGPQFRRIAFTDPSRGGLLSQGSILTVTSYPNRTSPVVRGKWLLENLLGSPPPPPPPNVPSLKENAEGSRPLSVRERLEEHRANPACASCHKIMDPLGFALENFDAVGRWRIATESGAPVDASGVLIDGTKVDGPASLRQAILSHPDAFVTTVTEKLLTYALGRGVESYDGPAIRKITREASRNNSSLASIIMGIVKSAPFQMRRSQS